MRTILFSCPGRRFGNIKGASLLTKSRRALILVAKIHHHRVTDSQMIHTDVPDLVWHAAVDTSLTSHIGHTGCWCKLAAKMIYACVMHMPIQADVTPLLFWLL